LSRSNLHQDGVVNYSSRGLVLSSDCQNWQYISCITSCLVPLSDLKVFFIGTRATS